MLVFGLTGGIGAGKSTVSARLEELGAVVVDADRIVRELQEPGEPAFVEMVEAFGEGIVADDGTLDRQAVADIVFNDPEKLQQLNGIVHPKVGARMMERLQELTDTDAVVILDVPLLVENSRYETAGTIVVDVDPDVAVRRLVEHRGFDEADARARMKNQASRDDRLQMADVVLDNSGTQAELVEQVDALWDRIRRGDFTHD